MKKTIFFSLVIGVLSSFLFLKKEESMFLKIQDSEGTYVSFERTTNSLASNRKKSGEWEKIIFKYNNDSSFELLNSESEFVYLDSLNQLRFINPNNRYPEQFKLEYVSESGFVLQTSNNLWIRKNWEDKLVADSKNKNQAEVFYKKRSEKIILFSTTQLITFYLSITLLFSSIIMFYYKYSWKYYLPFIVFGSVVLRIFIASLSNYLGLWDEQFHALVAKNMMDNPIKPMLYKDQVLHPGNLSWIGCNVWLHKQPLFLWQIALSLKIFGINTLAVRIPSILMSGFISVFVFRIGTISISERVGFISALLFSCSYYSLELLTGNEATDHNDIAFLFYVSASIWAFFEYIKAPNQKRKLLFLLLIGLFSGCAVLVKWLTGLLVYSGWFIALVWHKKSRNSLASYSHFFVSLLISFLVFIPWQIYISSTFPIESAYEYSLNTAHFFTEIEGHSGNYNFHFNITNSVYGLNFFVILLSFIIMLFKIKKTNLRIATGVYFTIVYLFFTLAATKMTAFTFCISFLVFLSIGSLIDSIFSYLVVNENLKKHRIVKLIYFVSILCFSSVYLSRFEQIRKDHTLFEKDEFSELYNRKKEGEIIISLDRGLSNPENIILFNCREFDYPQVMFFNDFYAAYSQVPTEETLKSVLDKGFTAAILDDGNLPDYINQRKNVLILEKGYSNHP